MPHLTIYTPNLTRPYSTLFYLTLSTHTLPYLDIPTSLPYLIVYTLYTLFHTLFSNIGYTPTIIPRHYKMSVTLLIQPDRANWPTLHFPLNCPLVCNINTTSPNSHVTRALYLQIPGPQNLYLFLFSFIEPMNTLWKKNKCFLFFPPIKSYD